MAKKRTIEDLLHDYAEGRLEGERLTEVERLLAEDEGTRQTYQLILALRRESGAIRGLQSSARALIDRFVRDLRRGHRAKHGQHGVLTFDSGLLPLPAGIRPAIIDSRRLKYTAGDHELEVSMYPGTPGTFEIIGQISGFAAGEILEVRLEQSRRHFTATGNRFQVFHFVRVPSGEYDLLVEGPRGAVCSFALEV